MFKMVKIRPTPDLPARQKGVAENLAEKAEGIIIILGYIREDIINNNGKNEQLEITIRFIEETKKGVYADISNSSIVLTPRSDEPTIYANEAEESALLSLCN